ncbi:MAG: helix-turn-helix domain-containing protein [Deltaproteobacteria bacterium]|nr:helix-turn-helix domain-containing protein [Deltaproteobacteria bacterium]
MAKTTKPQLIRARELAAILHVSQRHVWRMKAAGKLPKAVEIGECTRWSLNDIEAWIEMGCPSRRQFEAHESARKKR